MGFSEKGFGYTGRELERDVFGKFEGTSGFKKRYRELASKDNGEKSGYLPRGKAIDLIREFYKDDPTAPLKPFSRDLRLEIADVLRLTPEQEENLKFYTAVGETPLDLYHGVDAWIEYGTGKNDRVEVTLDVTKNTQKIEQGHKADVIIPDVPEPENDDYLDFVEEFGKNIAIQIIEKQKNKNKPPERRSSVRTFQNFPKAD